MRLAIVPAAFAVLSAPGAALAEPQAYEFDKTHTTIRASWDHQGYSRQSIDFTAYEEKLMLDFDDPSKSAVEITFTLADEGYWVGAPDSDRFEGHLASGDLFDVAKFPTARFVATGFETADGETGTMTGDLTIKDQTRPVSLAVTLNKRGENDGRPKAGFSASATLKRSDWGVGYAAPVVSDEVALTIEAEMLGVAE